jgi:hypothetical protein
MSSVAGEITAGYLLSAGRIEDAKDFLLGRRATVDGWVSPLI